MIRKIKSEVKSPKKNIFCDHGFCEKIHKGILVLEGGLIEIHGKEKMSWTHLSDHLFAKNQPVPVVERVEKNWQNIEWGPRIVLHILNAEGDLREVNSFRLVTFFLTETKNVLEWMDLVMSVHGTNTAKHNQLWMILNFFLIPTLKM